MPHRVIYQPKAEDDLQNIITYIIERSGSAETAYQYSDRIKVFCDSFVTFPRRAQSVMICDLDCVSQILNGV